MTDHHYLVFPGGSDGKESVCHAGDPGWIPGLGRSPGEGDGNPFQYSCLENPMDRGAGWATVHGVTKSQTWLSTCMTLPFWTSPVPRPALLLRLWSLALPEWPCSPVTAQCYLCCIPYTPIRAAQRFCYLSCPEIIQKKWLQGGKKIWQEYHLHFAKRWIKFQSDEAARPIKSRPTSRQCSCSLTLILLSCLPAFSRCERVIFL